MKTKMVQFTLVLFLVAGAAVAGDNAVKAVDMSSQVAALRAADMAWSEAAGRKDLDATVSYMTEDGETLAPNEPLASGKAAVRASWTNILGLPGLSIHWEPLRVEVAQSGELGYVRGAYTLSFTGADGKTVSDRGKYVEVWKMVDGKWKCAADAFNSDIPLQ